jgi:hypothetical protein
VVRVKNPKCLFLQKKSVLCVVVGHSPYINIIFIKVFLCTFSLYPNTYNTFLLEKDISQLFTLSMCYATSPQNQFSKNVIRLKPNDLFF